MVLGEVGHDTEGAVGDVVLRKASPSSIFDLKTSSISRPFIVSTNTEQGLLQVMVRIYRWAAPLKHFVVVASRPEGKVREFPVSSLC